MHHRLLALGRAIVVFSVGVFLMVMPGTAQTGTAAVDVSRRPGEELEAGADRLGRPGSDGCLFEQRRGRHPVRKTGPVRGPPARGHHRRRVEPAAAGATERDARTRRQRLGRSRRSPAAVLVGNPERHQQPRVARPRPAGRKIPPETPEARQRAAARAEARRRAGRGPADGPEDRSLYDRCISRGLPGSMMPAIYGSSYQIVQGPSIGRDHLRDDPRDSRDSAGRPFARRQGHPHLHGRRARPLGRQHAGRRDDQLQGSDRPTAAPTARRCVSSSASSRSARMPSSGRSRADDPATWTRPWTFAMNLTKKDASSAAVRVRVP